MKISLGAGFSPEIQRTNSRGEQSSAAASRSSLPSVAKARRSVRIVAVSFAIVCRLTRERLPRFPRRKNPPSHDVQLCTRRARRRLEREGEEARQVAQRRYSLPLPQQRSRGESDA